MSETLKNVIVSHGGRHGAGGTFLRGVTLKPAVDDFVPRELKTGTSLPVPAAAPVTPTTPPAGVAPPLQPSPTAVAATPAATASAAQALGLPKNATELHALGKEDLLVLAGDLGVQVEGEPTVKNLREALKVALEF